MLTGHHGRAGWLAEDCLHQCPCGPLYGWERRAPRGMMRLAKCCWVWSSISAPSKKRGFCYLVLLRMIMRIERQWSSYFLVCLVYLMVFPCQWRRAEIRFLWDILVFVRERGQKNDQVLVWYDLCCTRWYRFLYWEGEKAVLIGTKLKRGEHQHK
jgi:hypothetical protein